MIRLIAERLLLGCACVCACQVVLFDLVAHQQGVRVIAVYLDIDVLLLLMLKLVGVGLVTGQVVRLFGRLVRRVIDSGKDIHILIVHSVFSVL